MTHYDNWKVSGSCAGADEEKAQELFQEMHLEGVEFEDWYEGHLEDRAAEKADRW